MLRSILIETARRFYWDHGKPLPINVFAKMAEAGLDVEALEDQYMGRCEPLETTPLEEIL